MCGGEAAARVSLQVPRVLFRSTGVTAHVLGTVRKTLITIT